MRRRRCRFGLKNAAGFFDVAHGAPDADKQGHKPGAEDKREGAGEHIDLILVNTF